MDPDPGADIPTAPAAGGAPNPYGVAAMSFDVLGGIVKGMASIQAGDFNATIARQNAHLADLAAGDSVLRGRVAASYALLKGSELQAKQKTAYASAGVSVSSGSAIDVMNDTSLMSEFDAQTIGSNAMREAWGYETTATNLRFKAQLDEANGRQQAGQEILGGIRGAATFGSKMIGIA